MKLIAQYNLNGELVSVNYRHYYIEKGFYKNNISHCCRGELKTSQGYIWRYVDTDTIPVKIKTDFLKK